MSFEEIAEWLKRNAIPIKRTIIIPGENDTVLIELDGGVVMDMSTGVKIESEEDLKHIT